MGVVLSKLCRAWLSKLCKAVQPGRSSNNHEAVAHPHSGTGVNLFGRSTMGVISVTAVLLFALFDVHYFIRGILLYLRCKLRSENKPVKDPLKESVTTGEHSDMYFIGLPEWPNVPSSSGSVKSIIITPTKTV